MFGELVVGYRYDAVVLVPDAREDKIYFFHPSGLRIRLVAAKGVARQRDPVANSEVVCMVVEHERKKGKELEEYQQYNKDIQLAIETGNGPILSCTLEAQQQTAQKILSRLPQCQHNRRTAYAPDREDAERSGGKWMA